jgi:hypothetical protein
MTENYFELLKTFANVFSAVLCVLIGFFLNSFTKLFAKRKQRKQILALINSEIYNNLFAIIHKPEQSYFDALRMDSYEIIKSKIGSLSINSNQLQIIFSIYKLFERIDFRKRELEDNKTDSNGFPKDNGLNDLCRRCNELIIKYQKEYDKKNLYFNNAESN